MIDWLLPALASLPVLLLTFLLIGLPWALVFLPRADWRDRVIVLTLALALGPALLTAGMFMLGTFLRITFAGSVLAGAVIAVWGAALAWLKAHRTTPAGVLPTAPLNWWERLIVVGLVIAALARVIHVAYWPFTAYDALWVYGYNARVFTLTGQIPETMGYYPQFVPLAYTYAQLAWGSINDHAARMVIPIFAWGSILAAYVLGARTFGRRVGLLTAAFWIVYPHHAQWAQFGDLEVPLTFYFTLAAAFFLLAWRADKHRWHYAAISGLVFGGAMWTKPTAGAFVWGVLLVFALEAARTRFDRAHLWAGFRLLVVVGLACIPIGAIWYVRNILLGLPALVFPLSYWLTQAQRSGQELGWPLLILAMLALYLLLEPPPRRPDWRLLVPGVALMVVGALPSAGLWGGTLTHRLRLEEIAVMLAGAALFLRAVWRWRNTAGRDDPWRGWGGPVVALVAPYFLTWFYSYSYHPRLAFAITPLQLLLLAALTAQIIPRLAAYVRPARQPGMGAAALLCLMIPGLWLTVAATVPHLVSGDLPDDDAKHEVSNFATWQVVKALRDAEAQGPLIVAAPGALRLPFFFPLATVDTSPVQDLSALDDRVTHYVTGLEADFAYREAGTINRSSARAVTGLRRLAQRVVGAADADFWYEVYATNTALRWVTPFIHAVPQQETIYPGFAQLLAYGISADTLWPGREVVLTLHWQALGMADHDWTVFVHLTDGEQVYAAWDHIPAGLYHTYYWQPGEFVTDEFVIGIGEDVPPGTYFITAGLYDFPTETRLPVTLDGVPGGEDVVLVPQIIVLASEP